MIKKLFNLVLLIMTICLSAQMKDLSALMNNKQLKSQLSIFNSDGSMYGYIFIFNSDKIDKKHAKYEYLIFDKNLNIVAQNEFVQQTYGWAMENYAACKKMGNNLLLTVDYQYYKSVYTGNNIYPINLITSYRSIDLVKNTISNEFLYYNNQFQDLKVEKDNIKNTYKNDKSVNYVYPIDNTKYSGYIVSTEYKEFDENYLANKILAFDSNKKATWTYNYNKNGNKKQFQKIISMYWPDDMLILTLATYKGDDIIGVNIVGLNLDNGSQAFDYVLEGANTPYFHNIEIKKYDNKIYLVGNYTPSDKKRADWENRRGIYRIVIDSKGNELSKKYQPWTVANKFVEIKENGKLDGGYRLDTKEWFIYKDGTISYLTEKFKEGGSIAVAGIYAHSKSSDLILMNFDNQFNLNTVNVIEKALSRDVHYDYLFSQYINNNTGSVFFFQDFKKDSDKEKKWFLGINKIINGKYSNEEIPIATQKKYEIRPYPAKEGYILLREYNVDDKYDQIRLEKLNY